MRTKGKFVVACVCGKTVEAYRSTIANGRKFCSRECQHESMRKPFEEAFWARVNKTQSCWLWIGGTSNGRPMARGKDGKLTGASRIAWRLLRGPIQAGLFVCHDCPSGDNPMCVRPDHMFLGTCKDNMVDAARKCRTLQGERNANAVLSESDVRAILKLHRKRSRTVGASALSRRYGTTPQNIVHILSGRSWRHITGATQPTDKQ